ncbi:C-_U-editing enzyme APOBEC-2b [Hoplias malabaricus]|uniref:C->U-editing enzyme APOBEC-2b n=1 Tax=Hoplias malabaricus TaxID=27720 RepID=UPI00346206C5
MYPPPQHPHQKKKKNPALSLGLFIAWKQERAAALISPNAILCQLATYSTETAIVTSDTLPDFRNKHRLQSYAKSLCCTLQQIQLSSIMADKKTTSRVSLVKKKEKKVEAKATEKEKVEDQAEKEKEKDENTKKKPEKAPEKPKVEDEKANGNGETAEGAQGGSEDGEFKFEPIELPPFEIIVGDRLNPFFFKFQFKNVEYSSGRNKTFLCYQVDIQGSTGEPDSLRGYLEDEHSGIHAEEAFFQQVLPQYDKSLRYTVTWYTSSSPCAACAAKLGEILRVRKTLRLNIHCSRLFLWEEPEVQLGLKALAQTGCKMRMMRPVDFTYVWSTFVENEEENFTPWEDCQDSYEYYDEKLTNILQ